MTQLSGSDFKRLSDALRVAFPTPVVLEQMVDYADFSPRKSLADIVSPNDSLEAMVRRLIKTAESQGWLKALIEEAYAANQTSALQACLDDLKPVLSAVPTNHYKDGSKDEDEGGLKIHSRPPAATSIFRDRLVQTRELVEKLKEAGRCVAVVTGRPAIGKTALVARVFELLENEKPPPAMHAIYLSATGTVPLTPDLIRANLRASWGSVGAPDQDVVSLISRRKAPTLLVIDQVEALLKEGCDWADPVFGSFVREELRKAQGLKLVIVCTEQPTAEAIGETPMLVKLSDGLPPKDAAGLLRDADSDGQLGLKRKKKVVQQLVDLAGGHPRILELILAALYDDPLLTPEVLYANLFRKDLAGDLLQKSYANLGSEHHLVLGVLAVSGRPVHLSMMHQAPPEAGPPEEVDEIVRRLARRHLIKVDRIGQQIWLDRLDANFVLSSVLAPEQVVGAHEKVARSAISSIRDGTLKGSEADVWLIASVDHFLSAGLPDEASQILSDEIADQLEAHGLYDQLIRLHEMVDAILPGGPPIRATRLIRLYALRGSLALAREKAEAYLGQVEDSPEDPGGEFWAQFATVLSNCDLALQATEAFRKVLRGHAQPRVRARALLGLAQVARRKGYLWLARLWLVRALQELDQEKTQSFPRSQLDALAHHHIACLDRWAGSPAAAADLLEKSMQISKASGDRGGEAYRLTLGAALESDKLAVSRAANRARLAIQIYDEIHDDWGKAAALYTLAVMQCDLGRYEAARRSAALAGSLGARTSNTRIAGMVCLVELSCARRETTIQEKVDAAVDKCEEAEASLRQRGFSMYADQLALGLELDARIRTRESSSAASRLTTRPARQLLSTWPQSPATEEQALSMLRPLRHGEVTGPVSAGMQVDLERLLGR